MRERRSAAQLGLVSAALLAWALPGGSGCASLEAARAFERGTAALERGETAGALAVLEHAAALEPRSSAVHNHLGIAYEAAEDLPAAQRAYERAVELDCGNEAAQRNLAALRARLAGAGAP